MNINILIFLLIATIFPNTSFSIEAAFVEGSLEDTKIKDYNCTEDDLCIIDSMRPVWIIREQTEIYSNYKDNKIIGHLPFGEIAIPGRSNKKFNQRIEIKQTDETLIGWVNKRDLMSREKPLEVEYLNDKKCYVNVERKIFTKEGVFGYTSPLFDNKFKKNKMPRFEQMYVYAIYYSLIKKDDKTNKIAKSYLCSSNMELPGEKDDRSLKWIKKDDFVEWNNAAGIQPSVQADKVYIYRTIQDARNKNKENAWFADGNKNREWYKFKIKLPIIKKIENSIYEIAISALRVKTDKKFLQHTEIERANIEYFQNIDIFFLIDGTGSMSKYLNQVKNFISKIQDSIVTEDKFKNYQFRFGYRVYTDTFAHVNGIGDFFPLTRFETSSNTFKINVGQLKTTNSDRIKNDDNFECFYNGLHQAAKDINDQKNNSKFLIVIGDCGDRAEPNDKINLNNALEKLKQLNTLMFAIIQVDPLSWKGDYPKAYTAFETQSLTMLETIVKSDYSITTSDGITKKTNFKDYFIKLSDAKLDSKILEIVKAHTPDLNDPDFVQAYNSGSEDLHKYIEENIDKKDYPIIVWQWIENLCDNDQCKELKNHEVDIGYINYSNELWEEQVWLSKKDLYNMVKLLEIPGLTDELTDVSKDKDRFIEALTSNIKTVLKTKSFGDKSGSLQQYISKIIAVPFIEAPPLMQYTYYDIDKMNDSCEFNRMIHWLNVHHDILKRIYEHPKFEILFNMIDQDKDKVCDYEDECPNTPYSILKNEFIRQLNNREIDIVNCLIEKKACYDKDKCIAKLREELSNQNETNKKGKEKRILVDNVGCLI